MGRVNVLLLHRGKSYTTSSCLTPPGSEESKGTMVERCDIRGLPLFIYDLRLTNDDLKIFIHDA